MKRSGRETGTPNSTVESNCWMRLRTNSMFTGRVITWMRFVRTSAVSLILPTMIESSESDAL